MRSGTGAREERGEDETKKSTEEVRMFFVGLARLLGLVLAALASSLVS